ncbi:MAG TPA: phage tail sheath C-terminal domain-containing protein [Allosphingosinicella sp.]
MATTQPGTPGIHESDAFPPSVVAVDTAVPAFIGYTQTGPLNAPVRIRSMSDHEARFGGAFREQFSLAAGEAGAGDGAVGKVNLGSDAYQLVRSGSARFHLHDGLRMFFANGGSDCFVVSCGTFLDQSGSPAPIRRDKLLAALDAVADLAGPTILSIPDAALLAADNCTGAPFADVIVAMLRQCLDKGDRVAIIDVWTDPAAAPAPDIGPAILAFREGLAAAPRVSLRYGMAYFPNLVTDLVLAADVTVDSFAKTELGSIAEALERYAKYLYPPAPGAGNAPYAQVEPYLAALAGNDWTPHGAEPQPGRMTASQLTSALAAALPDLRGLFGLIAASRNVVPPSGAMAGLYASTDSENGVWTAPANVGIANVVAPLVPISDGQQQDMNAPPDGLCVNAIREFVGRGTLVWGARTLDGNSNDWRYIQVSRTAIFVDQSVKQALQAFAFAPNAATTWVAVTSAIGSFLHGLWAAGGLMGGTAAEAYTVMCGLGSTMTSDDVLSGIMRVQVMLQMVHPAEFIELSFTQQMLGGN